MIDINITNYYFKAEEVLSSCTNSCQVKNSLNYFKLYRKLTGDYCGYEILVRKYHKVLNEINSDD